MCCVGSRLVGELPVSARLAWWGTSWLRDLTAPDDVVDAVLGGDVTAAVVGLTGPAEPAETLLGGLSALRADGVRGLGLALPRSGDPLGLGGPGCFNAAALEAAEAVVALGAEIGLVPTRLGPAVTWRALPAHPRQVPDVGEADRALRATLLEVAASLAALDVARWRPELADVLLDLRHRVAPPSPAGVPPRCVDLAAGGLQALEIAALALEDDGGSWSVGEASARRDALLGLERAGRRALVAACSPEAWPPA